MPEKRHRMRKIRYHCRVKRHPPVKVQAGAVDCIEKQYDLLHYVYPFRELFRKASTFLGGHSVECLLLQFIKQKTV